MIDFKNMDEKDFVFVNKPLSDKEEKEFSEFLKARKTKARRTKDTKKAKVLHANNTNRQQVYCQNAGCRKLCFSFLFFNLAVYPA